MRRHVLSSGEARLVESRRHVLSSGEVCVCARRRYVFLSGEENERIGAVISSPIFNTELVGLSVSFRPNFLSVVTDRLA